MKNTWSSLRSIVISHGFIIKCARTKHMDKKVLYSLNIIEHESLIQQLVRLLSSVSWKSRSTIFPYLESSMLKKDIWQEKNIQFSVYSAQPNIPVVQGSTAGGTKFSGKGRLHASHVWTFNCNFSKVTKREGFCDKKIREILTLV